MDNYHTDIAGHCSSFLKTAFLAYPDVDLNNLKNLALQSFGSFAGIKKFDNSDALILTDHSGSIPVYYSITNNKIAVGWKPLDVALETSAALDPISAADFIANGVVCYPYTMFKDVFVAPPGAVSKITKNGIESHTYYQPREAEAFGSLSYWGERLREGVRAALNSALMEIDRVEVLFSGGEDSRAVASLLPNDIDVSLYTLADGKNSTTLLT